MRLSGQAAIDYAAQAGLALRGARGEELPLATAEALLDVIPESVTVETLPDEGGLPPIPRDSAVARLLGTRSRRLD